MSASIKGLIFDLDGVIVDTAKYHFHAWKRLANSLGIDFTEHDNEQLKGVSRRGSIDKILNWGGLTISEKEIEDLMFKKNQWYLELMGEMDESEILPGVSRILEEAKSSGLKIALGSASKNAPLILDQVNLTSYFEIIIDGNVVTTSKPNPEVFMKGAEGLGLQNEECVVFEDSISGVDAALAGGMRAVGIGHPETLHKAHLNLLGFENVELQKDILDKL
jgi:beta-phosphoglucomutase